VEDRPPESPRRASRWPVVVTLVGLEEELAATVHARHYYTLDRIRFGHRLVDIMSRGPSGRRRMDFTKFHDVEPVNET